MLGFRAHQLASRCLGFLLCTMGRISMPSTKVGCAGPIDGWKRASHMVRGPEAALPTICFA